MKILVASDIHGSIKHLAFLYKAFLAEKPNKVIFLGDMFDSFDGCNDELVDQLKKFPYSIFIRGNCDKYHDVVHSGFDFQNSYSFMEFQKRFFCSHGNIYNETIYPEEDFDIMLGGHTHIGRIFEKDHKLFLNPGSLSLPKGDSTNSYMIIDEEGIYLKDLNGKLLEEKKW